MKYPYSRRLAPWLLSCWSVIGAGQALAAAPEILVLSNRADLVSGGSALVQIKWPAGTNMAVTKIAVDGVNAKPMFALRADGRYTGLVTGLKLGQNVLTARAPGGGAQIKIVNHPIGGPVFSGPQVQPWICAQTTATQVTVTDPATGNSATATTRVSGLGSNPVDAQCNAAPRYTFYYMPKEREGGSCTFNISGANRCFEPFPTVDNPATRPADASIADFTNDRGVTVKAIVRVERGAINRGIYELVSYFDPAQLSSAFAPPKGWNGKLFWTFGGSTANSRFQSAPASNAWDNNALRRGYISAVSSLTDHSLNANAVLAAESMMMIKEHIIKNYGEVRFTMGTGCSAGSILQHVIATMYPGLVNAIQSACSLGDQMTGRLENQDCGLLNNRYYNTANGSQLTNEQRAAINGHLTVGFCQSWVNSFLTVGTPSNANNCGSGFPAALVYHPTLRPNGIRCSPLDSLGNIYGTYVDPYDGNTKVPSPVDSVGIMWGLKALRAGTITPEDFVRLNEGLGSYSLDYDWMPGVRVVGHPQAVQRAYQTGHVSDGRQLANVPIIMLRGNHGANSDVHMNWRAWQMRQRMLTDNGNGDNLVIWAHNGSAGSHPSTTGALTKTSVDTLDAWLSAIEADASNDPLPTKVIRAKPSTAADFCIATNGSTEAQMADRLPLDSPSCPVKYQASPRQAAGGSIAEAVFKCSLKPLYFSDPDLAGITFSDAQKARLNAQFASGVCDWTKPGQGQGPSGTWTTFAAGPGGLPLGAAPASHAIP